jgi:glycosyltransferase involved in cell wall biosynthesis
LDGDYLPKPVAAIIRQLCRWLPDFIVVNSQSTLRSLRLPQKNRSAVIFEGIPPVPKPGSTSAAIATPESGRRSPQSSASTGSKTSAEDTGDLHGIKLRGAFKKTLVVGIVGRLARWKGQHVLIDAAAEVRRRFPNTIFQIIGSAMFGENDYEAALKRKVVDLGLEECVEFLGFRDDVGSLIERLDVLVHASILEEPFGRVIAEGMLAGKPVVATRGGGVPEIVMDGATGLLVPMGDAGGMANAICKLLENPILREKMGREGKKRASEHFTTDQTVPQLESVFEQIGGSHRNRLAAD